MIPIYFKLSNKKLIGVGEIDGRIIANLPVWTDGDSCVSCWKMSWRERLSALFFGRCWISVLSGMTQPPIYGHVMKEYLSEKPNATRL